MAGRRKARVLPEPVRAAPKTSLPARRTGMDLAWMGVMVSICMSVRARVVGVERSRVEKGSRPVVVVVVVVVGVGVVGSVGLEGDRVDFEASSLGFDLDFEGLGLVGFDSGWSSSSSSSFSSSSSSSSPSSVKNFDSEVTTVLVGTESFFLFLVLFFLLLEAAAADVLVDIVFWGVKVS